jgi:ActR/RegA family two-component response regulator
VVLVVEDDELTRAAYVRCFERVDAVRVLAAADLATARKLLVGQNPVLAVVDRLLPDGDGIDLIAKMRSDDPNARLVLVSGNNETETTVRAMRAGADEVIDKPIRSEKLRQLLAPAAPEAVDADAPHSGEWVYWHHVRTVFAHCKENRSEAARLLDVDRNTLGSWLRRPRPPR